MHLQQSLFYKKYILSLGWDVIKIDGVYMFYRRFFLLGAFAKIQRMKKLPRLEKLIPILKKLRVKTIIVEAEYTMDQKKFRAWCQKLSKFFK